MVVKLWMILSAAFELRAVHQVPLITALRFAPVVAREADKFMESPVDSHGWSPDPEEAIDFAAWEWAKDYWAEKRRE